MIGQIPEIDRTMKGLGVLVGTQRPFIRFLISNWPLVAIAGFALYARGRERWKKSEFTAYNLMADTGLILSPLVGLALLNQLAQDQADRAAATAAAMPPMPTQQAPQ